MFFFAITLLCFWGLKANAQHQLDNLIPNDDKRKIEHARKLFNKYKIYEGEKILKELIKEKPKEFYYHEALVQLQYQVLDRIRDAGELLTELNPEHLAIDSTDDDEIGDTLKKKYLKPKSEKEFIEWNGLDRSEPTTVESLSKKEKRKVKREEEKDDTEANNEPTIGASQEIDTATSEAEDAENADMFKKHDRDSKQRKKQLKFLTDLAQIPYPMYKQDLIYNARNATRQTPFADSASHYLRILMVDTIDPDLDVSDEIYEIYEEGLSMYRNNDFVLAAKNYEKAISMAPNFYMAHIRLGDVYYLMSKDTAALTKYQQAALILPRLPDAKYKLALAYYNRGKYTDAAASIIEAIMIYPEAAYIALLKRIMSKMGTTLDTHWIQREVFPLTTAHVYEEIIAKEKTPWWQYQAAKQEVHGYYDSLGMVRPNEKTTEHYLEMYGWKYMLNRTGTDKFAFARVMQDIGYLDCYVLITLFHQDVYSQFADLVKKEPDKVKKYFYLLLNWEAKRFDKLREKLKKLETKKNNVKNPDATGEVKNK